MIQEFYSTQQTSSILFIYANKQVDILTPRRLHISNFFT